MLSTDGIFSTPLPTNESIRSYAPNTPQRASLKKMLEEKTSTQVEIPCVIGGNRSV